MNIYEAIVRDPGKYENSVLNLFLPSTVVIAKERKKEYETGGKISYRVSTNDEKKNRMRKNERIEPGIKNGNEHTMVIIFFSAAAAAAQYS